MNSDIIRLLPDSVANQIAAGEVIQRPASVIKELVENAVDAGATSITIILKDAGRTLIQVVDNGSGMSPTDARMAFERHATSKIRTADDLYSLHSMGFRGEALPSIAAVAQIDLRTMRHDDTIGTRLLLSESKFESQEPASCVPGTNLMVKNLFFHMPARRKFLKKDSIELGHIMREFERLALVNTDIDFTLIHNDITLHQFRHGTLKERISALFGKSVGSSVAPIATETSIVKIDGFIGMPRNAKKRGAQQFFFVNGRNMRHPFFHKAVMRCYEQLIPVDSQPSYFINIVVDPSTIDVNIHPQKNEVKFEHEAAISQILEAGIRETLGRTQAAGALDFDPGDVPDIPLFNPDSATSAPSEAFDENYNPFADTSAPSGGNSYISRPSTPRVQHDWQKLYENFSRERGDALENAAKLADDDFAEQPAAGAVSISDGAFGSLAPQTPLPGTEAQFPAETTGETASFFQADSQYIVTRSRSGIMVIMQRRAHIRILYERYMGLLAEGDMPSQQLLFTEDLELSPVQSSVLEANMERVEQLGFALKHNGGTRWSVTAIPAPLQGVAAIEIVPSLIEDMAEQEGDSSRRRLLEPLALALASASAIKNRQPLSDAEIDSLVAELFRCAEPSFTPDGLPVMTIVSYDELSRRFSPMN